MHRQARGSSRPLALSGAVGCPLGLSKTHTLTDVLLARVDEQLEIVKGIGHRCLARRCVSLFYRGTLLIRVAVDQSFSPGGRLLGDSRWLILCVGLGASFFAVLSSGKDISLPWLQSVDNVRVYKCV